jgi:16S rRNA (adenine1518-N6/adenine1519-N6)-dimethyltransferase
MATTKTKTKTPRTMRREGRPERHVPRKRFSQHFLAAPWAQKVVAAIQPAPGDVFVEIGPGTGALTLPLAASGAPVLAVEIDRDLSQDLAAAVPSNVTVFTGDFLHVDVLPLLSGLQPQRPADASDHSVVRRRFRIVGNLPYHLSSPMIAHLVRLHRQTGLFADATLMLQREVADRLVARPATRDYGSLSVLVQMHTQAVRLLELPPGAFRPAPKVRSSLIRLEFVPPVARVSDEPAFERLVKALFSQRRKTLLNALKRFDPTGAAVLAISGLDGRRRPETLQVTEIAGLAELFASVRRGAVL